MFPGIGRTVHRKIKNRGGFLKGMMHHMPWGDRVLLEKAFLIFPDGQRKHHLLLPGVIFRPNRELAKRTDGASTHIIYSDAYEAERGAKHAVVNYGARAKGKHTESTELKLTVKTLREYVIFLLSQGPHFEHVLRDLSVGMDQLAVEYSWKVDDKKKQAAIDMIRGLLERDSLGRRNPSASAMAMGGAIWNLLEREEAVQWLDMHMDHRAVQTERLISAHLELYQKLWDLVGKESAFKSLVESEPKQSLHTRLQLKQIHDQLEMVHLRPFAKNAKHTVRDLGEVLYLLQHRGVSADDEKVKAEALRRLKEGIRWVFVLDALQRGIIFPLSFLIDELLRAERVKRRKTKIKGRVIITSSMSPLKFDDLSGRLSEFERKLDKCQDDVLAHPVKNEVLSLLYLASAHIQEDDWRKVKTDLDAIAQIL